MMKKPGKIAQLGNSVLRQQAQPVEDSQAEDILEAVEIMLDTLSESKGVGLAAPQISKSLCIIIIASRPSERYPLAPYMEPVVMINPAYEVLSEEVKKDWEGCLSIPGIRALVPRFLRLKISYLDRQGEAQEMVADDFIARVFQHEYDHLLGMVYLDRIETNKDIISEIEFQKLMN